MSAFERYKKKVLLKCFKTFKKDKCLEIYYRMCRDDNVEVQSVLPEVKSVLVKRGFLDE